MKPLLKALLMLCVIFKLILTEVTASEITSIILEHHSNNENDANYRVIADTNNEQQNIATYYKLSELLADPKNNEFVILRGELLQSLNNKNLFIFQDSNTISNLTIDSRLWSTISKKSYLLNKKLQFLVKVTISHDNNLINLETLKIFSKLSDSDHYALTEEDEGIIQQLHSSETNDLIIKPVNNNLPTKSENLESLEPVEELDSIDELENARLTESLVNNEENKNILHNEDSSSKIDNDYTTVLQESEDNDQVDNNNETVKDTDEEIYNNETVKDTDEEIYNNETVKDTDEEIYNNETVKDTDEEIYNRVSENQRLKYKIVINGDSNSTFKPEAFKPEELHEIENRDQREFFPTKKKKKSFFSFLKRNNEDD